MHRNNAIGVRDGLSHDALRALLTNLGRGTLGS